MGFEHNEMVQRNCAICGTVFCIPDVNIWAYKNFSEQCPSKRREYFCSYHCFRSWQKKMEEKKSKKYEGFTTPSRLFTNKAPRKQITIDIELGKIPSWPAKNGGYYIRISDAKKWKEEHGYE